jgi:hypothetical protein
MNLIEYQQVGLVRPRSSPGHPGLAPVLNHAPLDYQTKGEIQ